MSATIEPTRQDGHMSFRWAALGRGSRHGPTGAGHIPVLDVGGSGRTSAHGERGADEIGEFHRGHGIVRGENPNKPFDKCRDEVLRCDALIVLVGHRYGLGAVEGRGRRTAVGASRGTKCSGRSTVACRSTRSWSIHKRPGPVRVSRERSRGRDNAEAGAWRCGARCEGYRISAGSSTAAPPGLSSRPLIGWRNSLRPASSPGCSSARYPCVSITERPVAGVDDPRRLPVAGCQVTQRSAAPADVLAGAGHAPSARGTGR